MFSESYSLLFPTNGYSTPTFDIFLGIILLVAVFSYCLAPGGLAWALSKSTHGVTFNNRIAIPGPSGLPIVGLVLAFTSSLTHRTLAKFAQTYKAKRLMAFSVGFTRFIVSSDPNTAKEILNSPAFADRPVKESAYELLFNRAMGFAQYSGYWRDLRRTAATHLFSPKRIASYGEFRRGIGSKMVREIKGMMERKGEVEIRKVLHFGSLNNVMMSVFGKNYDFGKEGFEVDGLVSEGYDLLGIFNWSDHFPLLGWLDLQGVRKRSRVLAAKVHVFVGRIVEEHRMKRGEKTYYVRGDESSGDFLDVLLDMEKENRVTDSDIIAVLWEMIFRGTDTVAILLEWILARLVLHPQVQAKAQSELDTVLGSGRSVADSDLPKLPYLRAIVKETLRMHPPGPLLAWARLSIHDTTIGQHFIPAGTTAMVNMWAVAHDSGIWSEPEEFRPDRFIEEDVGIMGTDLRLAPFGSGRRVCPGKAMGLSTVELWLAQLLQSFQWIPCDNDDSAGVVDLSECLKLSLEMKKPLVCKVVPRLALN